MNSIIEQLKKHRKTLGLKQSDLGSQLGLPQSHISKIEGGDTDARLSTIVEWARLLDHEVMLIPKHLMHYIQTLVADKNLARKWQLDEEDGDD